ncbi:hypothetical protein HKX48_008975 [Thoreauomyces humboldtii]|nr:hypothetical protein HKX48_008975 [Thoreauomyces humboldtii]
MISDAPACQPPPASTTLYELFRSGAWVSDDSDRLLAGGGGKDTAAKSIPQRLLGTLAARLVRTLDGLVVSPSVPPALVQLLPLVRPGWSLHPSSCGGFLAVLQDDKLEIRAKSQRFDVTGVAPLNRDGFPSWRQVAWSANSDMLAVSGSNGRVQLIRPDGVIMCSISPKTRADASGTGSTGLPTSPVQVDWRSIGQGNRKDRVGFIDPISVLFFVDPRRDSGDSDGVFSYDEHRYTHELITITYDGVLRSYLIHLDNLQNSLPARTTMTYLPALHTRRSSTPGLFLLRESKDLAGRVVFHHKFSFHHWHACVCSAALDPSRGVLLITGKAVGKSKKHPAVGAADGDFRNLITEWQLLSEKPHYQMKGAEFLEEPGAGSPSDLVPMAADSPGVWGSLRRVFSVDAVLTSIRPSRRKYFLDTIHSIDLSPDGKKLLTLDCGGTLKLWDAIRLDMIRQWDSSELRRSFKLPSAAQDKTPLPVDGKSAVNGFPGQPVSDLAISIGWWADDAIRFSFADGHVGIAHFPSMTVLPELEAARFHLVENASLNANARPELGVARFHPMPEVVSIAQDRLFILEHETAPVRMRLRDGVLSPIRAIADESDQPIVEVVPAKGLLETIMAYGSRPLRIFMDTILWHWEDDASPSQQTVTVMTRNYQLHTLLKTTPEEALERKISLEDYVGAMELATEHGLSKDEIYKARWLRSEVTQHTVHDLLAKIENREWVLETCVDRVPETADATRLLLRYGLRETDGINLGDVEKEIEDALEDPVVGSSGDVALDPERHSLPVATLCVYRSRLLKYLDRLETHKAIFAGLFSVDAERSSQLPGFAEHYAWFRDSDLISQAVELALEENFAALEVLFTRHGKQTLPYRLSILDFIPDTADPTLYKQILPQIDPSTNAEVEWPSIPWRKPDWTETESVEEFVQMLLDEDDGPDDDLFTRHDYPASHDVITNWYSSRARDVEESSGQADLSLDLVRMAARYNVKGLDELHEDLVTLSVLLYECYDPASKGATELSLSGLQDLAPAQIMRLFVAQADAETVAIDVQNFVLPYLDRISKKHTDGVPGASHSEIMDLLYDWILEISADRLEWSTRILESLETTIAHTRYNMKRERLMKLILECAYRCPQTDQWTLYERLLICLNRLAAPAFSSRPTPMVRSSSWEDELDSVLDDISVESSSIPPFHISIRPDLQVHSQRFPVHVESARILDRYGLAKSLAWFAQADGDPVLQQQLLVLLARRSTGEDGLPPGDEFRFQSEEEWAGLLDHILRLHAIKVLAQVPKRDIYVEFLSVILNNGMFKLAKRTLRPERGLPPLAPETAEMLIINAANEFFDNADSGDMTQGYLKKARDCLFILPVSPALQTELDFIQATHQLTIRFHATSESGEPILPIQIRLRANRLSFIQQVLERDTNAYRSGEALVDIARKLLQDQYTQPAQTLVQTYIATAALRAGDWESAYDRCTGLIRAAEGHPPHPAEVAHAVCTICIQLGTTPYAGKDRKIEMVAHALTLCPANEISHVLEVWTLLETERLTIDALRRSKGGDVADILPLVGKGRLPVDENDDVPPTWQFNVEMAINEMEREANHFDDPPIQRRRDGQSEDSANLHRFYESYLDPSRGWSPADHRENAPPSVQQNVLETLLRLKEGHAWMADAQEGTVDVSGDARKTMQLALETFPTDAIFALGYLLSVGELQMAQSFFERLPSSPVIEQIAAYFFALKGLQEVPATGGTHGSYYTCAPSEVLRGAAWLDQAISASSNDNEPPTISITEPHRSAAQAAFALSRKHVELVQQKEEAHKIRALYDREQVDSARFESSEEYRFAVVRKMAQTGDVAALDKAFQLAVQVRIPEVEVLVANLSWMFGSTAIDGDVIQDAVGKHDNIIRQHPSEVVECLRIVYPEIAGTSHAKLAELYKLLLSCADGAGIRSTEVAALESRLKLTQVIANTSTFNKLDLKKVFVARSQGAAAFAEAFTPVKTPNGLKEAATVISAFVKAIPVPFLDANEKDMADAASFDERDVVSSVTATYARSKLPTVPWEYLEEQGVASIMSQIISLLEDLSPGDLMPLTRSLTVDTEASGIPCPFRQDLVARALFVMERTAGHIAKSNSITSELLRIRKHLAFVSRLGQITDDQTSEAIPPERLQQFDMSYGKSAKQFASIVMRMIIGGTSPVLVYKLSQALISEFPNDRAILDANALYKETAFSILGRPSDPVFENVFRRGVDAPAAALQRVIASVIGFAVLDVPPPAQPRVGGVTAQSPLRNDTEANTSSGWDIPELDELASVQSKRDSDRLTVPASHTSNKLHRQPPPITTNLSTGEGWDIDGVSPVKSTAAGESDHGWDIGHIEGLSPVRPSAVLDADADSGWDIGHIPGLSPVKLTSDPQSGWDIHSIESTSPTKPSVNDSWGGRENNLLHSDPVRASDEAEVDATAPGLDMVTRNPSNASVPILDTVKPDLSSISHSSSASEIGWGLDDLDQLVSETILPTSTHVIPAPQPAAPVAPPVIPPTVKGNLDHGWDLDIDDLDTHIEVPSVPSATSPPALKPAPSEPPRLLSEPNVPVIPAPSVPETLEAALASVNETLKDCLNTVIQQPDRFGPDLGMQVFGILQKYFAIPESDARKLQSSKVTLIIKAAWNLDVDKTQLDDQAGRQQVLQTLLSSTRTAAQAQSLVAVLTEWLPPPSSEQSTKNPVPVPAYLQLFWMALLCWMIEHEEHDMVMLVRVEFAGYAILDLKAEQIILQTLRDMGNTLEHLKHGLITEQPILLRETIGTLHEILAADGATSSPSSRSPTGGRRWEEDDVLAPLERDRFFHVLVCARGLATVVAGTRLWRSVSETLTVPSEVEWPLHRALRDRVRSELEVAGFAAAASGLGVGSGTGGAGGGGQQHPGGDGYGVLNRLWGGLAAAAATAGSSSSYGPTRRGAGPAEKKLEESLLQRALA